MKHTVKISLSSWIEEKPVLLYSDSLKMHLYNLNNTPVIPHFPGWVPFGVPPVNRNRFI
jgi:hypothetical protein